MNDIFVPLVKWILRIPPKDQVQVRFLQGTYFESGNDEKIVHYFHSLFMNSFKGGFLGCSGGFANHESDLRSFFSIFSVAIHVYNCIYVGYPKIRIVSEIEMTYN